MSHPTYQAPDAPLRTDTELAAGVYALLGPALRRQTWILLLDEDAWLRPPLMPCDDLPEPMDAGTSRRLGRFVRGAASTYGAAHVAVVVERPSGPWLTERDRAFLRALHDGCLAAAVPVRAMLLSHRSGVRWVARDDYGFSDTDGR